MCVFERGRESVCERLCSTKFSKRAIKVQAWVGLVLKLVCTFCTLKINFEHAHSFVVGVRERGTSFVVELEHRVSLASEMIAIFCKGSVTRFIANLATFKRSW